MPPLALSCHPRRIGTTAFASSKSAGLKPDEVSSNRHHALSFCLSMIFSETRFPLFGIML
jgi:hypothetical protein